MQKQECKSLLYKYKKIQKFDAAITKSTIMYHTCSSTFKVVEVSEYAQFYNVITRCCTLSAQ
jgi:hypothetical protein